MISPATVDFSEVWLYCAAASTLSITRVWSKLLTVCGQWTVPWDGLPAVPRVPLLIECELYISSDVHWAIKACVACLSSSRGLPLVVLRKIHVTTFQAMF